MSSSTMHPPPANASGGDVVAGTLSVQLEAPGLPWYKQQEEEEGKA